MRTYPTILPTGEVHATEIDFGYISVGALVELIGELEGVSGVQPRRPFAFPGSTRARFNYAGRANIVWVGDSNRIWIGPEEKTGAIQDISLIDARLKAHSPGIFRNLLGNLLRGKFTSGALS